MEVDFAIIRSASQFYCSLTQLHRSGLTRGSLIFLRRCETNFKASLTELLPIEFGFSEPSTFEQRIIRTRMILRSYKFAYYLIR